MISPAAAVRSCLAIAFTAVVYVAATSTAQAVTFFNSGPIAINDATGSFPDQTPATATPYPSDITVAGVVGTVTKVTVGLAGFHHQCPTDVDMLLVGPHGQESILMSDAGDCHEPSTQPSPIDLKFDDSDANVPCLESGELLGGAYAPTDYMPSDAATCTAIGPQPDVFSAPAPPGPWPTGLSAFNGADPNGTWHLYAMDQYPGDDGSIDGGWSLTLSIPPATLSSAPQITGTPEVGETMTAIGGTAGSGNRTDYQWIRCNNICGPIPGANGTTYMTTEADRGGTLKVTESAFASGARPVSLTSPPSPKIGPPLLSFSGTKRRQRMSRQRAIVVSVKSNLDGGLEASGRVNVPSLGRTVRLKATKAVLRAYQRTDVTLRPSRRGLSALRRAVRQGKKLKAKLLLAVTDANGGKSNKKLTVKLTR